MKPSQKNRKKVPPGTNHKNHAQTLPSIAKILLRLRERHNEIDWGKRKWGSWSESLRGMQKCIKPSVWCNLIPERICTKQHAEFIFFLCSPVLCDRSCCLPPRWGLFTQKTWHQVSDWFIQLQKKIYCTRSVCSAGGSFHFERTITQSDSRKEKKKTQEFTALFDEFHNFYIYQSRGCQVQLIGMQL